MQGDFAGDFDGAGDGLSLFFFFDGAGVGESDDDDGEVAGDFPFFPPEVEFDDFDGDGALAGDFFGEAPLDGALAVFLGNSRRTIHLLDTAMARPSRRRRSWLPRWRR
ncbi:unnamed protein product [Linum trigynum]|uniref:Uncharacterized protein n=1 Tax=Linum trigynum TaxID=586398 RepID=A0AAV2FBA4_9ROSI